MFAAVFGGNKYEDAAELLEKACNNYKLAKMWREAASAFELLADCHLKSDSKHDAASAMVDAANANKKDGEANSSPPAYERANPNTAEGIVRYLWEVAYPGGASPTEALAFFAQDCLYGLQLTN